MFFRIERGTTLESLTIWSLELHSEFTTDNGIYCRAYYDSVYWTADGKPESRYKDPEKLYVFLKEQLLATEDDLKAKFIQLKTELIIDAETRIAAGAAALQAIGQSFRDLHFLQQLNLAE